MLRALRVPARLRGRGAAGEEGSAWRPCSRSRTVRCQASVFGDGGTDETAAFGILGGRSGCANSIELRYPDGTVYQPHLKDIISGIPAGTVYHQIAGGGGGYGDPRLRDATARRGRGPERRDLASSARSSDYGVALAEGTWAVDEAATAELRRDLPPG